LETNKENTLPNETAYVDPSDFYALVLVLYLALGGLSTWYGTKRGYRVIVGLMLSWLITPVLAVLVFVVIPRDKK
jgi:uncharacterized membrane protein